MAACQGPGIFSMKREKKDRQRQGDRRGWGGVKASKEGVTRGRGRRQGEAGPESLASNYSNSA